MIHRTLLILTLLLVFFTHSAAAQDPEPGIRVVANPDFVVYLLPGGTLEYWEVVSSKGYLVGSTPPGWRNDRLGRVKLHVVERGDGTVVELWSVGNGFYEAYLFRNGALFGSGQFRGEHAPFGPGILISGGTPTTSGATTTTTTTTTTVTTTTTTNVASTSILTSSGDSGARRFATGAYNPTTRTYLIAPGDTLFGIARRFGVNVYTLQYTNGITNWNLIFAGQALKIP